MNTDEIITTIDYIRDLAPDAEGWAQEQIANDLDQRDAEVERLKEAAEAGYQTAIAYMAIVDKLDADIKRLKEDAEPNAIEQAMLEKETWLSPSCYEELMRERQETLYEMALLRAEVERLREALFDIANRGVPVQREEHRIARAALNTEEK